MIAWPMLAQGIADAAAARHAEVARKLAELEERRSKPPPRSAGDWPDAVDVSVRLVREASALALALGHRLSEWLPRDGTWRGRCLTCSAPVTLSPRDMRAAPIKGEAVTFRCSRP